MGKKTLDWIKKREAGKLGATRKAATDAAILAAFGPNAPNPETVKRNKKK